MTNKNTTKPTTNRARTKATKVTPIDWLTSASEPSTPFITLDNQQRLYFNASTRHLCGNSREFYVGYDAANKSLIILPAKNMKVDAVKPFKLDSRNYAKAHALVDRLRIDISSLPLRYEFVEEREVEGETAFVFKLQA